MNRYSYRWNRQPGPGLSVEVEVSAANAIVARRTLRRFLDEHLGSAWAVESVSRRRVAPSPNPSANPGANASADFATRRVATIQLGSRTGTAAW